MYKIYHSSQSSSSFFTLFVSVALFSSEEKAKLFVPNAEVKNCTVIASKTGKLIDVDVEAAKSAVKLLGKTPVFA